MKDETELTYGEHLEGCKKTYSKEIYSILRNISLNSGDIENDILTNKFFERKDIAEEKLIILNKLTNQIINKLNYN